jgi:hypothetical protein
VRRARCCHAKARNHRLDSELTALRRRLSELIGREVLGEISAADTHSGAAAIGTEEWVRPRPSLLAQNFNNVGDHRTQRDRRLPARNEALRLQLEQAMELARQLMGNMVQAAGFFIAADTLLLGYGLSQKKAGALLFASLTVLGIFVSLWRGLSAIVPVAYVALYMERRLLSNDITLFDSLLRIKYPLIHDRVGMVLNIPDIQVREKEIRRTASFLDLLRQSKTFQALSVMFLVQLGVFFLAVAAFGYRFS